MGKFLALDLGNVWTGIAISDQLKQLARPLNTVKTKELQSHLTGLFQKETIESIIVGLPITSKAGFSQQTQTIIAQKEELEKQFPSYIWKLWNERFTSQQAAALQRKLGKKGTPQQQKLESHSLAAAFILDSFLATLVIKNEDENYYF